MGDLEDLRKILKDFPQDKIVLGEDFGKKFILRPYLSKECLLDYSKNKLDKLVAAKLQEKTENRSKYKAIYDINKNYDLHVVYKIFKDEIIIITAYKTSRKCQKLMQKRQKRV